jgi:DNA-binding transcriptional MerR regulator
MYTIRHAAALAGVSVESLRAWERRYGLVSPERTDAGYRLYDDASVERLTTMRRLIESGWSARTAAQAIVSGQVPAAPAASAVAGGDSATKPDQSAQLIDDFVVAARQMDGAALSRALDQMFASGSFDRVSAELLLPAMRRIGQEWAAGRLTVAAEHAASNAVLRRLGAIYEAAGREPALDGLDRFRPAAGQPPRAGPARFRDHLSTSGTAGRLRGRQPTASRLAAGRGTRSSSGDRRADPTRPSRRSAARLKSSAKRSHRS